MEPLAVFTFGLRSACVLDSGPMSGRRHFPRDLDESCLMGGSGQGKEHIARGPWGWAGPFAQTRNGCQPAGAMHDALVTRW